MTEVYAATPAWLLALVQLHRQLQPQTPLPAVLQVLIGAAWRRLP